MFKSTNPLINVVFVFLFYLILCLLLFSPALISFGNVLIGQEDIRLFLWIFWHYEQTVAKGQSLFFTDYLFYPEGISLTRTSLMPFGGLIYLALPSDWGPFGKITIMQIFSLLIGGILSYLLAYRFCKSFAPAFLASIFYNLAPYHLQKTFYHLNYSLGMSFLPLFFLVYYELLDNPQDKKNIIFAALALLVITLNEPTLTIMTGFIVFLDIFVRYLSRAGKLSYDPKRVIILALAIVLSLFLSEAFAFLSLPALVVYILPSLVFLSTGIFLILGYQNFRIPEEQFQFFQKAAIFSIPSIFYLAILAGLPSYAFSPDSFLQNTLRHSVAIDNILFPSDLQLISHLLPSYISRDHSESAIYLGISFFVLLFVFSTVFKNLLAPAEQYFQNFFLLSLLFSFPLIIVEDTLIFATPFFVGPLFPLLNLLRAPSRFIIFALLFGSVLFALLIKKAFQIDKLHLRVVTVALTLLLLIEHIPSVDGYIFSQKIPEFYKELALDPKNISIFLYPNFNYYNVLNEVYWQTIHKKKLSYGILSRFPVSDTPLLNAYSSNSSSDLLDFATKNNYGYVVVQKTRCTQRSVCFYGNISELPGADIADLKRQIIEKFGPEIYEDNEILVFRKI